MTRVLSLLGLALALSLASCADLQGPVEIQHLPVASSADNHHSAAGETKAFVGGWLEGEAETVALRYTRSYFCEEPPVNGSATECEVGAEPEAFPRAGVMPKMYALAPAFQPAPDPATVHCRAGMVCPNHPAHLDLSLVGGGANAPAVAHSHIVPTCQAGWHETVNIRIASLAVWNAIAYEPDGMRLAKIQSSSNPCVWNSVPASSRKNDDRVSSRPARKYFTGSTLTRTSMQ